MLSEEKRLVALLQGDGNTKGAMDAFSQLYERYHGMLYHSALKFVKSDELAQEVVQEVFIKLWETRSNLKADLSLSAYLYTMTRNRVFNMLKRAARESRVREHIRLHAEAASNTTENNLLFSEYQAAVKKAIAGLPPQRQRIFIMCREEGKSYEEVAGAFGISKSTVRDHMVKALKSVRQQLYLRTGISASLVGFLTLFR